MTITGDHNPDHKPVSGDSDTMRSTSHHEKVSVIEMIVPVSEEKIALERHLKQKIDFVILPLLAMIYFLASSGRSDLANANVAGLSKDLHLDAHQYSNLASFLQIGYILLQIPGTVLVRKIGPQYQFGTAMLLWGIFTACNVVAKSYGTLLGLRILVGCAEAFIQGAAFYLSFWYTYTELASRGAIFFSTSTLAGAFNGLIAYAVENNLKGVDGWAAWQWLYLIEGILPIGCAFFVIIFLPPTPEKGHFLLTKAEREQALRRSRRAFNPEDPQIRPKLLFAPLMKLRWWLLTALYAFNHYCAGSLSNFLPVIIEGFGYSSVKSQLMSVIVYATALVGIILFARIADKLDKRGLPLLAASAFAALGYIMLLCITNEKGRLAATCILAFGIFPTIPLVSVWLTTNVAGFTQRASAFAMSNMIAQAFSIAGTQAYIDPPLCMASALAITCAHITIVLVLLWVVKRANLEKVRIRNESSPEELERLKAASWDIVGDQHIDFDYGY